MAIEKQYGLDAAYAVDGSADATEELKSLSRGPAVEGAAVFQAGAELPDQRRVHQGAELAHQQHRHPA